MSVSDIIVLLMPVMFAVAWWFFSWFEQRLPPAKRKELDYYAEKAVKCIEQTYTGTSLQKKSAAVSMIYAFFKAANRTAPSQVLVDAAIEEVVWEINRLKIPGLKMLDTGPIKAVPRGPDAGGQPA